jgi:SAM-dependent methyltransferase
VSCGACGDVAEIRENSSVAYVEIDESIVADPVDRLKSRLKRFGKLYNLLIDVISPVYPLASRERSKAIREASKSNKLIMNLGSGSSNFGQNVINVDILPYETVDVICSIDNLPFANDSVDLIVNVAVLEHVPNPEQVVSEFFRVLKPGGKLFCFVPFIQGFHASPWDFQRYTKPGLQVLFAKFDIEEIECAGPTSGMLWTLQEWIAISLSFGSKKLHTVIWLGAMLLTWPFKYLDFFLRHHPMAENISSGFSIKASKP